MEIDPDVAALLDDLPRTRLPEVLVEAGWGAETAAEAQHRSVWAKTRVRSTVFQPTFEPCVRCGRPVTQGRRGEMTDHAGRTECDHVFDDDEFPVNSHVTQKQIDEGKKWVDHLRQEYPLSYRKPAPTGPCGATRSSWRHDHVHECEHPITHFGFHECKVCHHLWH